MVHKSSTTFLEPKMLLLYIFLVSCCLPGSTGSAVEEFQANLEALVALSNKEIFLPVPKGQFQCRNVPCQLESTIKGLKRISFKNNSARTHISLMEANMNHITSTLKKTHAQPESTISCLMTDLPPEKALKRFTRYFQELHENCWES